MRQGFEKHNERDWYGAIAEYSKAIQTDPNHYLSANFYYGRAKAKMSVGDKVGSISDLTDSILIDKKDANGRMLEIPEWEKRIYIAEKYKMRAKLLWEISEFRRACRDALDAYKLGLDTTDLMTDIGC